MQMCGRYAGLQGLEKLKEFFPIAKTELSKWILKHRCLIPANGFYEWTGEKGGIYGTGIKFSRRDKHERSHLDRTACIALTA